MKHEDGSEARYYVAKGRRIRCGLAVNDNLNRLPHEQPGMFTRCFIENFIETGMIFACEEKMNHILIPGKQVGTERLAAASGFV